MSNADDRAVELLEVHQIVWIDHEVGYDCGCNEDGDQLPGGLRHLTDAIRHQVQALDRAGLVATEKYERMVAATAWQQGYDEGHADGSMDNGDE